MYRGLMPQTIQGDWPLVSVTVTPRNEIEIRDTPSYKKCSKRRSGGGGERTGADDRHSPPKNGRPLGLISTCIRAFPLSYLTPNYLQKTILTLN
jgi:hypothetical protein